ncbi:alpha/beta hydrolase [Mucilaginibacter sp. BJC16-A38]|uniref:alpha/beta fold hydrolase n=1 Tax=Mucilaginibacter phenanthrenivorans TaxID=1234842 RepID=UPI002157020A|nr:alpha/beta hydrolase [Mucilaginibacter phenanthrenivorans]MCR8561241.1 alpha/beta hydrolase [Mucilaginibacter phenanthrenivorans]
MKPFIIVAFFVITAIQISCSQKSPNQHKKISDQGVNIAYTDTGKGDTTLLLVHGWCLNRSYWANQVNYFSNRYRVVTIDLPGFGQSGKNRTVWTPETYGRDVDSVIAQLSLKNVILVGHSMAGDIVLQAAVNAPDKVIGLVGVDNFKGVNSAIPTKKDSAEYDQVIGQLKHNFKKVATDYFNQDLFSKTTPDSIKTRILADVAKADTTIATACMMMNDFNEVKQLIVSKKKLYLINSDVTLTISTGLRANKIPYQVKFIHGVGHFPMVETPVEFNKDLEAIIKSI